MERIVDLATWPRADQFRLFRRYARPHFATTARVDVTHLMTAMKLAGHSPFRACIRAVGAGLHAVPELRMRARGGTVMEHDRVELSITVPLPDGNFRYAYVPWLDDAAAFDALCRERIEAARAGALNANSGERDDLAYLSCLPWMDFTALDNALPGPEDCIPRVSWGRIVERDGRHAMAVAIQVHHALVDGRQVGQFFAALQAALDR